MSVRKEKNTRGLLFIWADVDKDFRIEYQKWHNCEHMADRVTIPGFYVGRRYQGIGDAPDFLMLYETDDSKMLAGEAYLKAKNNPTPWTREIIKHFSNNGRNILSLVAIAGKNPPTEAPYLFIVRFDPETGSSEKVIDWYGEKLLSNIATVEGVYRGRLYEVDKEVSDIKTEEQNISGSEPGQQSFFALYEIASPDVPTSKNWRHAFENTEFCGNMKKRLHHVQEEFYWLDFTMYAPQTH